MLDSFLETHNTDSSRPGDEGRTPASTENTPDASIPTPRASSGRKRRANGQLSNRQKRQSMEPIEAQSKDFYNFFVSFYVYKPGVNQVWDGFTKRVSWMEVNLESGNYDHKDVCALV